MVHLRKANLPVNSGSRIPKLRLPFYWCFLVAFMVSSQALASNSRGETIASDTEEDPAYFKLIKDGLAEYDARNFQEARSFFQRAHRINPNARTFRSIGMASFELRDYVMAVRNLTAALKNTRRPLLAEQVKHTQDLLERSRLFVDAYRMTVTPKTARVLIDGRVPEYEDDGTLILGFGLHALEASSPGYAIRSLPINVRGGERKDLSITLEKLGDPTQVLASIPKTMPPELVTETKPTIQTSVFDNPGVLWLMSAGAAALVAGAGGYFWNEMNKEFDKCPNLTPPCDNETKSKMRTARNKDKGITIGGAALAAILTVVSIVTWDSPPDPNQKQGLLDCTLTPFGASCVHTF